MTGLALSLGGFALLFVLLGLLRLRSECPGDGSCHRCHGGSCDLKREIETGRRP